MNLVKSAQNEIRLLQDLRAELGFTNTDRAKVNFTSAVRKLAAQGYVERIYVYKRENPDRKYYCIKFIKDLPAYDEPDYSDDEDGGLNDFMEEEGEAGQNETAEEIKAEPDLQDFSFMSIVQPEPTNQSRARILFNQYYPLETQIVYTIDQSGTRGIPGVELTYKLTGSTYLRILTREFNLLVGNGNLAPAKMAKYLNSSLGYLVVIRGVDFSARMKFYRYFSNKYYTEFTNATKHSSWGKFRSFGVTSNLSLTQVDKKSLVPIPGRASLHWHSNGTPDTIFFGDVGKKRASGVPVEIPPPSISGKKRGRPSKASKAQNEVSTPSKPSRKSKQGAEEPVESLNGNGAGLLESFTNEQPETLSPDLDPSLVDTGLDSSINESSAMRKRSNATPLAERSKRQKTAMQDLTESPANTRSSMNQENTIASFFTSSTPIHGTALSETMVTELDEFEPPGESSDINAELHQISDEILTTEKQVSQAIEAASKQYGEEAIDDSLQNTGSDNIPPQPQQAPKISFVMMKRVEQVTTLLREKNGIIQGGIKLTHELKERFSKENGSVMDKKTVMKVVRHLKDCGQVWEILVTVPNPNTGTNTLKSLLMAASIDKDDPRIEQMKSELFKEIRSLPDLRQIKIEENEFKVYAEKMKEIERRRAELQEQKNWEREQRKGKAAQRLERTDKERREVQQRKAKVMWQQKKRVTGGSAKRKSFAEALSHDLAVSPHPRKSRHSLKGDDPLLTLPLEGQDIRNSKRISLAREEPTEVAKRNSLRKRRRVPLNISTDMFFRIAIIGRSLFSATGNIWVQVAEAIPGMNAEDAKSVWPRIRDMFGEAKKIDMIVKGWEKIFLQAYEDGEIPIFRNDNYDLAFLARFWSRKYPRIIEQSDVPFLFENLKDNEDQFIFKSAESMSEHDSFFKTPSMTKQELSLSRWSMAFTKTLVSPPISKVSRAKVGIKAIIATTDDNYDKEKAKKILHDFGEDVCTLATREMDQEKAIVYVPRDESASSDRNFMFSEKFLSTLHQRLGPYAFDELDIFYAELLKTLNESKGYIMSRMAPDSSLACALDMICHEKVDLVRVNATDQATEISHNSRAIDRSRWECDVVVRSPLRYIAAGEKVSYTAVERPLDNEVTLGEPCSTIWTALNGQVSHPILRKLVYWLLIHIESRPGVPLHLIQHPIQFILTLEEIELLLGWLERQKCVRKGPHDGYWVNSEWYALIGV